MHELSHSLLQEIVSILDPAMASRVAGVAVDSLYA